MMTETELDSLDSINSNQAPPSMYSSLAPLSKKTLRNGNFRFHGGQLRTVEASSVRCVSQLVQILSVQRRGLKNVFTLQIVYCFFVKNKERKKLLRSDTVCCLMSSAWEGNLWPRTGPTFSRVWWVPAAVGREEGAGPPLQPRAAAGEASCRGSSCQSQRTTPSGGTCSSGRT